MMAVDTKAALLAEAGILVRTVGYPAFSFAELSARVGIRKASVHHHFPTKEMLGIALVDACLDGFVVELDKLAARRIDARSKLLAYGDFFVDGVRQGLKPLCGALAADSAYLPPSMQRLVKKFMQVHLEWLEQILREGMTANELRSDLSPSRSALLILGTLEGSSLVAWALKDPKMIKPALKQVLDSMVISKERDASPAKQHPEPEAVSGDMIASEIGPKKVGLDEKTRQLITLAVSATARCDEPISVHPQVAVNKEAAREDVAEALGAAVVMNVGAVLVYSARALEALEALEADKPVK